MCAEPATRRRVSRTFPLISDAIPCFAAGGSRATRHPRQCGTGRSERILDRALRSSLRAESAGSYAGETERQDLGSCPTSLGLHGLRDARLSIVVLPASTTTELKSESEMGANADDVFTGTRSSDPSNGDGKRMILQRVK